MGISLFMYQTIRSDDIQVSGTMLLDTKAAVVMVIKTTTVLLIRNYNGDHYFLGYIKIRGKNKDKL